MCLVGVNSTCIDLHGLNVQDNICACEAKSSFVETEEPLVNINMVCTEATASHVEAGKPCDGTNSCGVGVDMPHHSARETNDKANFFNVEDKSSHLLCLTDLTPSGNLLIGRLRKRYPTLIFAI